MLANAHLWSAESNPTRRPWRCTPRSPVFRPLGGGELTHPEVHPVLTTRQLGASPLRYRKPARAQAARVTRKLALESLEDRTVPVLLANQLGAPLLSGLTATFSESVPPSLSPEPVVNSSTGNEAVVPSTTGVLAPGAVPPP